MLHVIGASEMAQGLREFYGRGDVVGWTLQPMAETRTLLAEFRDRIAAAGDGSDRGYNQLERSGFVYGEEVQACPDEALLDLRNIGPAVLPRIRAVLPYTTPPQSANAVAGGGNERATLLARTLTPLRAGAQRGARRRARRLTDAAGGTGEDRCVAQQRTRAARGWHGRAAVGHRGADWSARALPRDSSAQRSRRVSGMTKLAALEKIIASLNSEPVPPADGLGELLLDTAGLTGLLDAGLHDDLTGSDKNYTLDFLPGGAPVPGDPDRVGTVVATRWGAAPYVVLAENVSLRRAWETVFAKWPDRLSDAFNVLSS
ncbi:hypothetical protein [Amycolatopsis sp. FDAARGOS 1241]|uniref:hypothetical protein n=1 Tax=Amycolatopsis sp. FDAARGOS 1241 TaxID=2778070 RepID=UPI00194FA7B9|nr:hypothetical protein I6J71_26335 [Amycolatopsis sp. FDAARGOS 1241]